MTGKGAIPTGREVGRTLGGQRADTGSCAEEVPQISKRKLDPRQESEKVMAVDKERVEAIRRAIAEGRFEINPERIARALIEFETELFDDKSKKKL
ncbi:MAG: flagellar biosynthesis anti-sigma factor FlgM [Gammaproteobacteria bacterium]